MRFADIVGLEPVKDFLRRQVAGNRVPHAQLFIDQAGATALPLAIAFAQYLACENPTEEDACGLCPKCHRMEKLIHPDLHFALPEAGAVGTAQFNATYREQMETLRELMGNSPFFTENEWYQARKDEGKMGVIAAAAAESLLQSMAYKPVELKTKILILWLPERLNATAANRLLKFIEEPPKGTVLLFVTENPSLILPTIASRLQNVIVPPLSSETIKEHLLQKELCSEERASSVAHLARGSLRRAYLLAGHQTDAEAFSSFKQLVRSAYENGYNDLLAWSGEIAQLQREQLKTRFAYFARMVRAAYMVNIGKGDLAYADREEMEFLESFAPYVNGRNVGRILEELSLFLEHLARNANPRILCTDFALRIAALIGAKIV